MEETMSQRQLMRMLTGVIGGVLTTGVALFVINRVAILRQITGQR